MAAIVASWIVSPVFGAGFAALMLYFIKTKILYAEDRLAAANKWVPVLIALMAGAFMAYMSLKGLRQIWRPSIDRKSTRLNSSHYCEARMPSSARNKKRE